jgi:hypothetical protein
LERGTSAAVQKTARPLISYRYCTLRPEPHIKRRWQATAQKSNVPAVKTRLKELVKRHHPDANGGDRSSEGKLREIIQAYNYLKSIWFR